MSKLKYFLYWLVPFVTLCLCGYNLINAIWIYFTATDHLVRLDGYAYLVTAIIQAVIFILFAAIATALTVYSYRKRTVGSI